jgi:acid phosphatase type 7
VYPMNKVRPWWTALYNGGGDLVLGGHVHSYERFAELRPDGAVDTARGIREFVVGTGGAPYLYDFKAVPLPGSQKAPKDVGSVEADAVAHSV